jgi:CBS domain-containing protein
VMPDRSRDGMGRLRPLHLAGIVTDRDVVVRAIAEDRWPAETPIGDIASRDVAALSPNDSVDAAVQLMRQRPCDAYRSSSPRCQWGS